MEHRLDTILDQPDDAHLPPDWDAVEAERLAHLEVSVLDGCECYVCQSFRADHPTTSFEEWLTPEQERAIWRARLEGFRIDFGLSDPDIRIDISRRENGRWRSVAVKQFIFEHAVTVALDRVRDWEGAQDE